MTLTSSELLSLMCETSDASDLNALRMTFAKTMCAILGAKSVHLMGIDDTKQHCVPLSVWPQHENPPPAFRLQGQGEESTLMVWALNTARFNIEGGSDDYLLSSLKTAVFGVDRMGRFAIIPARKNQDSFPRLIFFALVDNTEIGAEDHSLAESFARYCDSLNQALIDLHGRAGAVENLSRSLARVEKDRKKYQETLPDILSGRLVGRSKRMQDLRRDIARFGPSDLAIFIHGETGTGKELAAREIHRLSVRRHNPFVAINVTALPKGLEESELFGFVKGAFTGADRVRKGFFAEASGGTLFFDEIGDMSLDLQAKLLRVLQEKTFRPLGSNDEVRSDFRLISATHRNIEEMVSRGEFREDLFYRLTTFTVQIPTLRERIEDVGELADYFLHQTAEQNQMPVKQLSGEARRELMGYEFPGNVRQLQALLLRATFLSDDAPIIEDRHIRDANKSGTARKQLVVSAGLRAAVDAFERDILMQAYRQNNGQRSKMAEQLKIPLRTLADKMKKYTLEGKSNEDAQDDIHTRYDGITHNGLQ